MRKSMAATLLVCAVVLTFLPISVVSAAPGTFLARFRVIDKETGRPIKDATVVIAARGAEWRYMSVIEYKTEGYETATGYVMGARYERIADGRIVIDEADVVTSGFTDSRGEVEFVLPLGEYTAWASCEGYIGRGAGVCRLRSWNSDKTFYFRVFELPKLRWIRISRRVVPKTIGLSNEVVTVRQETLQNQEWPDWHYIDLRLRQRYSGQYQAGYYKFTIDLGDVWLDGEPLTFRCTNRRTFTWRLSPLHSMELEVSYQNKELTLTPTSQSFTIEIGGTNDITYRSIDSVFERQRFGWPPSWGTEYYFEFTHTVEIVSASIEFRGLTANLHVP